MGTEERTRLRMHPERSVPDEVDDILRGGLVAHLGFQVDGQPFVIPMLYHYDAPAAGEDRGRLFLHGGTKSRAMRHLASGAPVCVTVTLLDQLVYSKTALDHSANYRSAVCFGRGRLVEDPREKNAILERMVSRYFEGRTGGVDYQHATSQHLKATALAEIDIEEASGKIRAGDPNGPDDDDPEALGTAGLVDI
ncbi:MAG: pyridoxamine 5'-phosphate oxidase family protein [Gemmatimonadota bacterium]|nr:pyridoxamine 5'-phosphate oxidase family protein [Gemmatimonadota bacterium]